MRYRFYAKRVEELRKEKGLLKSYLANKLGVSLNTFGRYMREETPIPLTTAAKLAYLLDTSVDGFVEEIEDK